jgi:hypothetical protein
MRNQEKNAVNTGIRLEYILALLMPISFKVLAKKTKASEDARILRKRNEEMISGLRCTVFNLALSNTRNTGRNKQAPIIFCQATRVIGE